VTTPAAQPPFALDGTISRDKLLELLAAQAELPELDFKTACDLNERGELVEITKDLGAMMIRGGYLVVGASDSGQVLGLPNGQERLFDEATLVPKVTRYLAPSFQIRVAVHQVPDTAGREVPVALVWAGPHPDGCCLFIANGEYDAGGKPNVAFRAGQVYARHGTRSEPAAPKDLAVAVSAVVARHKEDWRAEHADETRRALQEALSGSAATGPSSVFTWALDAPGFEAAAVELLRRNDDIPVRRMLRAAVADAQRLVLVPGDLPPVDLTVLLDRLAALAALSLDLRRPAFFQLAVRALLDLYGWAVQELRLRTSAHPFTPVLWLRIAERLYGLGALAVRLRDWPAVRELALAPVPQLASQYRLSSWHRDALTQASRADLFTERQPQGQTRELSMLLFARAAVASQPVLRPDLPGDVSPSYAGPDPLLDSLCQFDWLVMVTSAVAAGVTTERALLDISYPNYARADGGRTNVVVPTLLFDPVARQALVRDATDGQLALVLQLADEAAQREGRRYWGWEGYTDPAVTTFIQRYLPHG